MQNIVNSGVIMGGSGNHIGKVNITGNSMDIENFGNKEGSMSEADWRILEEFLVKKQLEYGPRDERYKTCSELVERVEKKDEKGLKNVLKQAGKGFIETILGVGVTSAVRTVILTILDKLL